jgi:hypothetical protein
MGNVTQQERSARRPATGQQVVQALGAWAFLSVRRVKHGFFPDCVLRRSVIPQLATSTDLDPRVPSSSSAG